jgi:NADPH-dependent 2,4-dienoyl-CoA reductase/sulfur reductase-like enzyme
MTIKKEQVCIAGNGPNAYLAARIFLEHGVEVTLIYSHHDMSQGT